MLRKLLLIATALTAACAAPAGEKTSGSVRLAWPEPDARIRGAELRRAANESGLTIAVDFFTVDFSWNESGNTQVARYLIPAIAPTSKDDSARLALKYGGEEADAGAKPDFTLKLEGVPVMAGAKMVVQAFAAGMTDKPLLAGEADGVEITPEGIGDYTVAMKFTKAVDEDNDGFIPAAIGGGDCDDADKTTYEGAPETCDGRDTACDGRDDEVTTCTYAAATDTPMQLVPASTAYVGWSRLDDTPRKKIYHPAFAIDRYEVSLAKYAECATCTAPASTTVAGFSGYAAASSFADFPVMHVSWWQAYVYCADRGKRLPTEFEWEVAARGNGNTDRATPWDYGGTYRDNTDYANLLGRASAGPVQVSALPDGKSPFGVYNMMGNADEWTQSWYDAGRYDGIDEALQGIAPPEPASGTAKVTKGGGWSTRLSDAFVFRRASAATDTTSANLGFRCALTVP